MSRTGSPTMVDYVVAAGFILAGSALGLTLLFPPQGILVRLRAQYNPKPIRLDPETEEGAYVMTTRDAVPTSLYGMFKRVWRIEGWHGLYRGIGPASIVLFPLVVLQIFALISGMTVIVTGWLAILGESLVILPLYIIMFRAVTTPEKLSFFNAKRAIHVLLSRPERRRPWLIYLTPGILSNIFINKAYVTLVLPRLGRLAYHFSGSPLFLSISPRDLVRFGIMLIGTAVETPLRVMFVRLAIQRNHTVSTPEHENDDVHTEEIAEFISAEEQVLQLRTEQRPYTGLWDCAKCIVAEEGFWTLYCAWWWTLLEYRVSPVYKMALGLNSSKGVR